MRKFGGERIASLMDMMGVDETMPISAGMVSRAIEGAQRKVEAYYFDIRKNILQYDDVLTEQRKLIYEQRRKVLNGENLRASISHMIRQSLEQIINGHLPPQLSPEDWEEESFEAMLANLNALCPALSMIDVASIKGKSASQLVTLFDEAAQNAYLNVEAELTRVSIELKEVHGVALESLETDTQTGENLSLSEEERHPLRRIERDILLSVIDSHWIDYLHNLDGLRDGIGLRAYGQKDPLIEYKREAFEMFQNLTYEIQRTTVMTLFNTQIEIQLEQQFENGVSEAMSVHHTPITDAMAMDPAFQEMLMAEGLADLVNLDDSQLEPPKELARDLFDVYDPLPEQSLHAISEEAQTPLTASISNLDAADDSVTEEAAESDPEGSPAGSDPQHLTDELERLRRARANKSKPF
jgi:preprotein translocase subunit SecA